MSFTRIRASVRYCTNIVGERKVFPCSGIIFVFGLVSQIAILVYKPGRQSEGGHRSTEIKTSKMLNSSYL